MKTKSNKIKDIIFYIKQELKNKYDSNEIKSLINILFEEYANMNIAHILAFENDNVSESELLKIVLATQRLKKEEPIQYILGYKEVLKQKFIVNKHVLIPRDETEELIKLIIEENNQQDYLKIADLCTGSGCIALSLNKYLKNSEIIGVDISKEALKVAKKNNINLKLKVDFKQYDLLNMEHYNDCEIFGNEKLDIIVSNPPYVLDSEKIMMNNNVLLYEPDIALFVKDKNPVIFYEKIAMFAKKNLKNKGKIYLEVNNFFSHIVESLFPQSEYITEVILDFANKNRFIKCKKIC